MSQLFVIKGAPATFNLVVTRNNVPVDLTGADLVFLAKRDTSDLDSEALIAKGLGTGITVTNASAGLAQLRIDAIDTADLSVLDRILFYTLVLDAGLGEERLSSGTLSITLDTTPNLYIQVSDVRAAGLTADVFPDDSVLATIKTWQKFLERATRQWFYPLGLELNIDGTDSDTIHFGIPIIELDELRINGSAAPLEARYFKTYNSLVYPLDKQNPRIKLIDNTTFVPDIYTAPLRDGRLLFRKGRQNQYIRGVFGYIEEDGGPPEMIKRALLKLVVEKLTKPVYITPGTIGPAPPPLIAGLVLEEWTDDHKVRYAQPGGVLKERAPGLAGITDDQEILGIIRLYRAPIGLATPEHPSWR